MGVPRSGVETDHEGSDGQAVPRQITQLFHPRGSIQAERRLFQEVGVERIGPVDEIGQMIQDVGAVSAFRGTRLGQSPTKSFEQRVESVLPEPGRDVVALR